LSIIISHHKIAGLKLQNYLVSYKIGRKKFTNGDDGWALRRSVCRDRNDHHPLGSSYVSDTSSVARNSQWGIWRGSGDKSLQPPQARRTGSEAPSFRRFLQFFNNNNAFLCIFRLK